MKIKTLLFSLMAVLLFGACSKDEVSSDEQLAIDIEKMNTYLIENGLTAQETPSGLHYIIEEEGTGTEHPTANSDIIIHYKGYLLDGTVFDQSQPSSPLNSNLGSLIPGWQEGIPLFKKGGKGVLLIPSRLAYGTQGSGSAIPGNSVIIFDIELINFN